MAHAGEKLLSRLRDLELLRNPDITTALLPMVDAVRRMMQSIEAIGNEGERNDEELIKMLTRVQQGGSVEEGPPTVPPAVASPAPPAAPSKLATSAPSAADAILYKKQIQGSPPVAGSTQQAVAAEEDGATNGKSKANKDEKESKIVPVEAKKITHADESDAPQAQQSSRGSVGDSSIRVDVMLLDKLMNLVGELALARDQVRQFSYLAADPAFAMPAAGEKVLRGHAVMALGYDDSSQRFTVRNSWGPGWGMGGYFTIPYGYLTDSNLADDFWTIRLVAKAAAKIAEEKAKPAGSR